MIRSLLFFAGSLVVSLSITALLVRYWKLPFGMDHPDAHRKQHARAVPRLGGIPIFAVFFICMAGVPFYMNQAFHSWAPIFLTSTMIFFLGLVDDFRAIGAKVKLLGQTVVAMTAYLLGLQVTMISYPLGSVSLSLGAWGLLITVVWLIAIPNIINLIDGVDGLAAGLSFVLYLTLGYVSWQGGSMDVSLISFAVAGALLGFLIFNFPPAKIFLGDGGAYLLGFGIAVLSLQSAQKGSIAAILLVTMIALGLPIMDTVFALLRRGLRGFPLFHADAEHIHHRLQKLGFSERRLVVIMYVVTVFLSFMALSVFWSKGRTLPIALGVLFLLAVVAVRYLGYIWTWAALNRQVQKVVGRRESVRFVLAYAQVAELEVTRCDSLEQFREVLRGILDRCGIWVDPPGGDAAFRAVEVEFKDRPPWKIYVPEDIESGDHYVRLVHCFRTAYSKACEKWRVGEVFPGKTN